MRGQGLWRMDEERKEMERLSGLTLSKSAKYLEMIWENEVKRNPELPGKVGINLLRAIKDVIACV